MTYQLEKQVADRLKAFFEPFDFIDKVVIFGSRAKHNANPKSDIDLCIYSLEMSDAQFSKLKLSLDELPILYKIDIVHFEKSNEALRANVAKDGKLFFVKKANFGDVALFIRNGLTVQQDKNKKLGCPITRIETISNGVINFDAVGYADLDKDKYESWLLKKGDILISHINSEKHLGKSAIYTDDKAIIHGMNLLNLRVKENISPKYLFYYLKTPTYKESIHKIMKKSVNQASFSLGGFKNIEIPLPSLTKQKEIAQTLDKASELIELRKATIQKLDELAQSIFIDMFGDPVSNPKKWDIKEIRDLILEAKYGTSEKSSEEIKKYAVLRMNNLTYSGCLDLTSLKYMDLEEKDKEKYLVKKGDLLFNRTNSKELVGKTAVYNREEPMAFAGYLIRVRCEDLATNVYISAFLNSKVGKKLLTNMCKSIVGMANINAQELQNIKIAHPPLELQQEFAKTIEKIESQKSLYESELTKLQATFDALLSQSFEG